MHVTLLGTGSALPSGQRAQTGMLVEVRGTAILIDCGAGILHRLARTEPGYAGLDAVLLSHHHVDHVADLVPLLKARWLADAGSLPIYGPSGTSALVEDLLGVHDYLQGKVSVDGRDLQPDSTSVAEVPITIHEAEHSMQCFAYRVVGPDGDLTVSGDTEPTTALAEFASGSAVLVHDCSFPDGVEADNHPTATELGRILEDVDLGRVVLTHLYPQAAAGSTALATTVGRHVEAPVDVLPDETTIVVQ